MRSRLVVPAVLLVTAAYVKGRRDGRLQASVRPVASRPPIPPSPLTDQVRIAQALAADAVELAEAQVAAAGVILEAPPQETLDDLAFDAGETAESPDPLILDEWVTASAAPPLAPAPAPEVEELDLGLAAAWAPGPIADRSRILVAEPAPVEVEVLIDETGRFSLGGFATQAGHIALCGITFQERRSGLVTPESITLVTEAANNVADGGLVVLGDAGFAPDAEGFTILLAAAGPGTFAAAGRYELGR